MIIKGEVRTLLGAWGQKGARFVSCQSPKRAIQRLPLGTGARRPGARRGSQSKGGGQGAATRRRPALVPVTSGR